MFAIPGMGSLIVNAAITTRLPGGAGRGVRDGAGGDRAQSADRRALQRARSADHLTWLTCTRSERRPNRLGGFARWLRSDLRGALSLAFLAVLVAVSAMAPWDRAVFADRAGRRRHAGRRVAAHWLGTDDLGRDVLSRLIYGGAGDALCQRAGGRASPSLIGVPVGLLAGYLGGWVDDVISRVHRHAAVVSRHRAGDRASPARSASG